MAYEQEEQLLENNGLKRFVEAVNWCHENGITDAMGKVGIVERNICALRVRDLLESVSMKSEVDRHRLIGERDNLELYNGLVEWFKDEINILMRRDYATKAAMYGNIEEMRKKIDSDYWRLCADVVGTDEKIFDRRLEWFMLFDEVIPIEMAERFDDESFGLVCSDRIGNLSENVDVKVEYKTVKEWRNER